MRYYFSRLFIVFSLAIVMLRGEEVQAKNVCFSCHDRESFTSKVVHIPVAKGQCIVCHNPHVARFEGLLQQEGAALCKSCHENEINNFQKAIVHGPVRKGKCLACHDPHKSKSNGLINGKLRDKCVECHKSLSVQYKVIHEPFGKGNCNSCHQPHHSRNTMLLKKDDPDSLCFSCHKNDKVGDVHKNYPLPVKKCLTCHNPHGSNRTKLMRNILHEPYGEGCDTCHKPGQKFIPVEICLECHEEMGEQFKNTHSHLTDGSGNSCANCHSPHAGDEKKLLKGRQVQICRVCHEETFRRFEDSRYVHMESVKDCHECHAVHGSGNLAMLRGDGNEVCSRCHESQGKFTHPVGNETRDPRTGQPMTCVHCHNPHGTNFVAQLRLDPEKPLCNQCHQGY